MTKKSVLAAEARTSNRPQLQDLKNLRPKQGHRSSAPPPAGANEVVGRWMFKLAALCRVFKGEPLSYILMQLILKKIFIHCLIFIIFIIRGLNGNAVLKKYSERVSTASKLRPPTSRLSVRSRHLQPTLFFFFFCSRCFLRDMLLTLSVQKKSAFFFITFFSFLFRRIEPIACRIFACFCA